MPVPDAPEVNAHDVVLDALRLAVKTIYTKTAEKPEAVEITVPRLLWHAIAADSRLRITRVPDRDDAYRIDGSEIPIIVVRSSR